MIKKLRMKLIVASMLSLFIVLLVIVGGAAILNYRKVVFTADETLAILRENGGSFPSPANRLEKPPKDGKLGSPELPYESRYFTVTLNEAGTVVATNTGKIAAVDTATAMAYAQQIWREGRAQGFVEDYRYIVYTADAQTQMIFLDCGRSLDTFRTFALTSAGISAAGLLCVLLLMIFFSGRIVKPFSENYEKQKRFITDAGHELKTPLTIIDADTEILSMDLGENEWLSDIQSQTRRLADLTNNLILLSRMQEEQPQSQRIDFPLSDVVEETAMSFQALAKTQDKVLTTQIQPMIAFKGDEGAIRRLVTVLLDNAVKYSQPQGRIALSLCKQRNLVRLSVYNTTESICKADLEHLFDRFYRADQSRNSQTGGYGLGLSIAAAIVSAHRGKIWASTEDEASLQITVTLPA